jgi:ribonuclease HI
MLITINTDASYRHDLKMGSYAFWIVCNQGKIMRSGPLKEAKSPLESEMKCIANALHCLLHSNITDVHHIIINSDALHAFERVGLKKEGMGKEIALLLKRIRKKYLPITEAGKIMHEFRHVKAHSGTESARKWVNDWCDKAAKKALREFIKQNENKK